MVNHMVWENGFRLLKKAKLPVRFPLSVCMICKRILKKNKLSG